MKTEILTQLFKGKISKINFLGLSLKLENITESQFESLSKLQLKNPYIGLLLSLFLGGLGLDRFYKGDKTLGFLKLGFTILGIALFAIFGPFDFNSSELLLCTIGVLAICIRLFSIGWQIVDTFLVFKGIRSDNFKKIESVL